MGLVSTFLDFLLVAFGFGLIVFIHELGHFLAARWAGIRVLAFAVGFGPALVSFRKGLGLRRGSSEREYIHRLATKGADLNDPPGVLEGVSPTEYRLNVLPFGGYVKMLGQVDGDASITSEAADGYQRCVPWKRMVVISAGVIANLILAAGLFVLVFSIGLKTEPPMIGAVVPGSPAELASVVSSSGEPVPGGLRPGDTILTIDGARVNHFPDAATFVAMAPKGKSVRVAFERDTLPYTAEVRPEVGDLGLLQIGIEPAWSATLQPPAPPKDADDRRKRLDQIGLAGVKPGWSLVSIDDSATVQGYHTLVAASNTSNGRPLRLTFASPDGTTKVTASLTPAPRLEIGIVKRDSGPDSAMDHLLGLTPVMAVGDATPDQKPHASDQGFKDGDVFARLGGVEFPNVEQGMRELASHKGRVVPVSVLRKDASGAWRETDLPNVNVTADGKLGFSIADTAAESALLSKPPAKIRPAIGQDKSEYAPAATRLIQSPGQEIVTIDGIAVKNFAEVRHGLQRAVLAATPGADVTIAVGLRRPSFNGTPGDPAVTTASWTLTQAEAATLMGLGWDSPVARELFAMQQFTLRGDTVMESLTLGLAETRRVMISTYLTFKRLTVDRTVKVEHLKGPVGIAHLGTAIASRGFIWLLFFLALISVNLAVINFLPLPIVDGGQFLFLVYEQFRGRPAPIAFQNVLTFAGLILIAGIFLIVTFNDVKNLFGL